MKRTISLWLGLLALAVLPAVAQKMTGKIHGHVTDPAGIAKANGTVSLSDDGGKTSKFTFPVGAGGEFSGDAAEGTYTIVYRAPETPPDKMVDSIDEVKIVPGQDVLQDMDMTRKAYMDKMTPEDRKRIEDFKKQHAEVVKTNEVIKNLNADLAAVRQDLKDKKYDEAETLMVKDTGAKPDAPILWVELGLSQIGLKKYDESETAFKKALELDAAAKKPNPEIGGVANSGLGEIYARQGKIPEANAAYDAAAKANPPSAGSYLSNEAVIFFQVKNADAQVAAADEAIKIDPARPILYYLKGNGLVQKATFDAKTQKIVAPPGCIEAYQKYLELAPDGTYANEVKEILTGFGQKINSSFKAGKK